jgi:AraC-like DNA-binding protein
MNNDENSIITLSVDNMINPCCEKLLRLLLEKEGVTVLKLSYGEVKLKYNNKNISLDEIENIITSNGFNIIKEKEKELVNRLKATVYELVHHTTFNAMIRNSDFIVQKFNKSYQYLSALFSKYEGITLEKYIILQKIEKVKQLIIEDNLTLSEIAYMMGYSSVQYLSTQFKNITGITVTEFKKNPS